MLETCPQACTVEQAKNQGKLNRRSNKMSGIQGRKTISANPQFFTGSISA